MVNVSVKKILQVIHAINLPAQIPVVFQMVFAKKTEHVNVKQVIWVKIAQ
jgi:hypothetical protein